MVKHKHEEKLTAKKPTSKKPEVKKPVDKYGVILKRIGIKAARIISRTSLPEIAFISSFIFGHYLLNADFQYPGEIILPIIIFAILATVIFYLMRLITKSWLAARISSLALIYALYSYSYLPRWLQSSGKFFLPKHFETTFSNATLSVVILAILCAALGYGLARLAREAKFMKGLQLHKIVLFAVLFIFAIQGLKVVNKINIYHRQMSYQYPKPDLKRAPGATITKPDIYYFVFDRYGSNDTLQKVYGINNNPLTDYLAGQGFVNRLDAKANYPFTMESISSTMAMQYHTGLMQLFGNAKQQTAFPYRSIFNDPPIAQVLKQNGYIYNQLSSWWDFTRVGVQADGNQTKSFRLRAFGKNYYLSDLTRDVVNKSILSPWLKKGLTFGKTMVIKYDNDNNPRENFYAQEAAVKQIASSPSSVPQFTFTHFLAPHDPYIFDSDGSDPTYDGGRNDYGEDETVKYKEEITYLNTQIRDIMGYIRLHSPNAVIVIQSDEGPYPKEFRFDLSPGHYYDPANLPLDQEKQKFGVLASYYMPGVDAATVQQNITSSVNPFRFILKQYLGYDINMLPDCQFATGDKYVIYKYENETPKLQTNPPAACNSL
ncbi:MAG: hypothetical protein JWO47_919 [Candidatus Saccharibacteria bacterium]|nr:hypothetical protein [Candidatus Saccharibacteria bacterium]